MSPAGIAADLALEALFVPFVKAELPLPAPGQVLFLRARDGFRLREIARPGWTCQQSFKPFADALLRSGLSVGEAAPGQRYRLVLVLPPRQRDEARALFAQALTLLEPGGQVVAAVPNAEGARSAESDLSALAGPVGGLSKHKCRVFWTAPGASVDAELQHGWLAVDQPRRNPAGYYSRPGLFAWDRIDRASSLLVSALPSDLRGAVADLGAGYGYLSCELLRKNAMALSRLDLYEAEGRALEPARLNLAEATAAHPLVASAVIWHDVTDGLPTDYDVIVSNPPFHQGRADLPALGRAFIARAADALRPDGRFFLVANRHLPYESILTERFGAVRQLLVNDGFKVIEASKVRG